MTQGAGLSVAVVKILVADDEPDFRVQVRRTLEREGYAVQEAADGTQALERLQAEGFDLAIVDLLMPGATGIQFLAEVRAMRRRPPPTIIVSAFGDWGSYAEALNLGAAAFLSKPLGMGDLVREVARALTARPCAGAL
jgi:CheY-like chemotaxis protein